MATVVETRLHVRMRWIAELEVDQQICISPGDLTDLDQLVESFGVFIGFGRDIPQFLIDHHVGNFPVDKH
ncbi:MAG: hypothetical protein RIS56_496, partial [Verrucomicrobiota bacterium]